MYIDDTVIKYIDSVEVSESLYEQIKKATVFKEAGSYFSEFGSLKIVVNPILKNNEYRIVVDLSRKVEDSKNEN